MNVFTKMSMVFVIIFAFASGGFAGQNHVEKGKMMLGTSTGLSFNNSTEDSETDVDGEKYKSEYSRTNYGIDFLYGYFLSNGFEIGPTLGVNVTKSEDKPEGGDTSKTDSTEYSFGIQAGYWFFIDSKLYPYVLLPLEYTQSKTESKSGEDTSNRDSSGMSLTPEIGLTYFISKEAALGFGLYYEWASLKGGYEPYEGEKRDTNLVRSGGGLKAGLSLFF